MRFVFIFLLLSGCASVPKNGITIVWHKLERSGYVFEAQVGNGIMERVNGYSRIVNGVCHVWAPDPPMIVKNGKPTFDYGQWGTLGHEVKHCFDGRFHD